MNPPNPMMPYDLFAQYRAEQTGQTESEIRQAFSQAEFEQLLHNLHQRWLNGEISFGRFTELIGVPHWELWEILEAMKLPLHV